MASTYPGSVLPFNPQYQGHLAAYLAALHALCISSDGTVATFLPPLNHDKLLSWWRERIAEAGRGERAIFCLFDLSEESELLLPSKTPAEKVPGPALVGVVMLAMGAPSETGPYRATVESLMVMPKWRRRGGARAMMRYLEADSLSKGKMLLMANAETGTASQLAFQKLGFTEIGVVPRFYTGPNGERDSSFFYKRLDA